MEEQRLVRIENKLDQLAEAVVSLARMEERMVTLFKRMDSYDEEQRRIKEDVSDIKTESMKRGVIFRIVDRAMWLVAGAVIVAWARDFFS